MPIGRRPAVTSSGGVFVFPNTTASGAIRAGAAVALIDLAGAARLVECAATSNAGGFQGFAVATVADGDPVGVITLRGSLVTPILLGGGALTADQSLFLSGTNGEVTHTPPAVGYVLRVGNTFSTTQMFLNTDVRVIRP
jgi:hypothetical protein